MSFDDGSLGRREDGTDPAEGGHNRLLNAFVAVFGRLRTHVREWPGRYVETRTRAFEK